MTTSLHDLKVSFRSAFPEYARALDEAKSQVDIKGLHTKFLEQAKHNLAKELDTDIVKLENTDQTAPIALTDKQYQNLINAKGDAIMSQLHVLLDGMARLKTMENYDAAAVTVQLMISGVVALGAAARIPAVQQLVVGAVEAAAAYAGVEAATVGLVCAVATLVIVAILIPIIYFMQKPANCIILLINELDDDLVFKNDYNVHGKPMLMTTPIPQAVSIPGVRNVITAGFIATEKKESALYGTQYGFTFSYKAHDISFGVECPLTDMYVDNNCYCGIDISAQQAAEATDSSNKQSWMSSKNGITLEINCNSGSGSIAYFVARAYKSNLATI